MVFGPGLAVADVPLVLEHHAARNTSAGCDAECCGLDLTADVSNGGGLLLTCSHLDSSLGSSGLLHIKQVLHGCVPPTVRFLF